MSPEVFINGIMCGVAPMLAAYAPPRERLAAFICAASLFPIWAIYTMSFQADTNLAIFLTPYIGYTRSADVWAALDLFGGITAFVVARRFLWGDALLFSFALEAFCHTLRWDSQWLDKGVYYQLLDWVFRAQICLFILIGGRGFVDAIVDRFGPLVGRRPQNRTAQAAVKAWIAR